MLSPQKESSIGKMITSYNKYALGDIKKSLKEDMLISTFILCTCFIDSLVNRRYFGSYSAIDKWDLFFKKYFPNPYKGLGKSFYSKLRCKIVHNYSGNRYFALGDDTDKTKNMTEFSDGRIFLHVKTFVQDTTIAYKNYKNALINDDSLKRIALDHDKQFPIFQYSKIAN
jgi:hypothetical protein